MTRTTYTPLSPIENDNLSPNNISPIDSDNFSILSNAAPQSGYQAYRPPPSQRLPTFNIQYTRIPTPPVHHPISWPGIFPSRTPSARTQAPSRKSSSRTQPYSSAPSHTPPQPHSIAPSRAPSFRKQTYPPTRTPSNRTHPYPSAHSQSQPSAHPAPSFHSQLSRPYDEALPWAQNVTHFRTASSGSESQPFQVPLHIDTEGNYDIDCRPSKQYHRQARYMRKEWRTGVARRFPWRGGVALIMLVLLTPSSIAILLASKSTPLASWNAVQPSTYLSIIDVFTLILTLYALFHGVTITFWTSLLRGTSISDLHRTTAPIASLLNLRWHKKVFWASVFAFTSLARGPLLHSSLILSTSNDIATYGLSVLPLVLGTLISYAGIFAIIPLYANFSLLGRTVSLHPLEIARAFGSPLFDGLDGNVGARDIELERGHVKIRYGAVEKNGEEKILRVGVEGREVREGEIFG